MKTLKSVMLLIMLSFLSGSVYSAEDIRTEQSLVQIKDSIDAHYQRQLALLEVAKDTELMKLEIANTGKFIRTGFWGHTKFVQQILLDEGIDLEKDREFAELLRKFKGPNGLTNSERLTITPKLLAVAEQKLAEKIADVLIGYQQAENQLQRNWQYAVETGLKEYQEILAQDTDRAAKKDTDNTISGIVFSQNNPMVIIDGGIYREGDTYNGKTITRIDRDSVKFGSSDDGWEEI